MKKIDVSSLCREHKVWRNKCTNLIASENINLGEEEIDGSSFSYRYAEGKPYKRYYNGTRYIDELEYITKSVLEEKLNCNVNIQPTSGTIANIAVFSALKKYRNHENNNIMSQSLAVGGHISHNSMGAPKILDLNVYNYKNNNYDIDIEETLKDIKKINPCFLIFGRSMVINYKKELKAMKKIKKSFPNIPIVYDAAHTFGMIYQKELSNPFKYGADIITASTHKTFPGPQGGIILWKDEKYSKHINSSVFPGLVSNHHLQRIPELLQTIYTLESNEEFKRYSKYIKFANKKMHQYLKKLNYDILTKPGETHQIVIDFKKPIGKEVANKLELNNIIVNKNALVYDKSVINPSGIRIGVQEVVLKKIIEKRLGMNRFNLDKEIKNISDKIINIINSDFNEKK